VNHKYILNYYLQLEQIKEVVTEPTDLESTCLILAYGLDMFMTKEAPEKSFDALTDEFNFKAVVLTIAIEMGLIIVIKNFIKLKRQKHEFLNSWY